MCGENANAKRCVYGKISTIYFVFQKYVNEIFINVTARSRRDLCKRDLSNSIICLVCGENANAEPCVYGKVSTTYFWPEIFLRDLPERDLSNAIACVCVVREENANAERVSTERYRLYILFSRNVNEIFLNVTGKSRRGPCKRDISNAIFA